jgi:YjbE family integral membrane protein
MTLDSTDFWIALAQIIGINIVLSGDNAVVIALAARSLPPKQQKQAVLWGSGAAVVMRIVLTVVAVELLKLPWLKLVGALLLFWIAVKLLLPEQEGEGQGKASAGMAGAVKTILIADLVMSLDNVIAVAAAAKGSLLLLIVGLGISIPLVIFGSTLLLGLMERFPVIITIGAALLGWVAGEMMISDPVVKDWIDANAAWLHYAGPAAGAALVVVVGRLLARRHVEEVAAVLDDLAAGDPQPAAGGGAAAVQSRAAAAAPAQPEAWRH